MAAKQKRHFHMYVRDRLDSAGAHYRHDRWSDFVLEGVHVARRRAHAFRQHCIGEHTLTVIDVDRPDQALVLCPVQVEDVLVQLNFFSFHPELRRSAG